MYGRHRSFKMASKSEEHLAGDNIEGILAVIDSDILAEQNDLETVCSYCFQNTGY